MPRPIAVFAGLVAAGLALFMALPFAAGGWRAPFVCSLGLPFLYPAVLVRLTAPKQDMIAIDATLLVIGAMADIFLYYNSAVTDRTYFQLIIASWGTAYAWLVLWGLWQILALATIVRWALERPRTGRP